MMKVRIFGFVVLLLLIITWAATACPTVEISGVITSDTTWTNTATVMVTGILTVTATGRLEIQPGTVIHFYPGTGLYIEGQLDAEGQINDRIVFTSSADTTGGTPQAGAWNGVMFQQGSEGTLRDCDLRYGVRSVNIQKSSPTIYRCIIEDFSNTGINITGNNANPPITPTIEDCRIAQDEPNLRGTGTGIYVYVLVDLVISGCAVSACSLGMDFKGYALQAPHFQVTGCEINNHKAIGIYAHTGG